MDSLRLRLANPEAVGLLALMGLATGLTAGLVIAAFRLLIETTQAGFLPGGDGENYEGLAPIWRFLLPALGGLFLGWIFHRLRPATREVGVVHVIERLEYYEGRLPLGNAVVQFLAGALAVISGQSVGREGPGIHLGAASGSQLAQRLGLPHNSMRTMVACGTAAAIAASFNTPLAGVVFAMEVIMLEYRITSFIPVMIAAIAAATVSIAFFGSDPAFSLPEVEAGTLAELPLILLMGLAIGALAAAMIRGLNRITRTTDQWPVWIRFTAAGVITGLLALVAPEIMGTSYDTVNATATGELALQVILLVLVAKIVASTIGLGLGLPGGLIGPVLVIGALAGGAFEALARTLLPETGGGEGLYAIVGMGAMMGATLQAPLAALIAVLEMTLNAGIILPAMLAIVTAGLTSHVGFGQVSVFRRMLQARGLDHKANPVKQRLRSIGVASVMDRRFAMSPTRVSRKKAQLLLEEGPPWLLVLDKQREPMALLPAIDLARFLEEHPDEEAIELTEIPGNRLAVAAVHIHATLQEAITHLEKTGAEALYVERPTLAPFSRIHGLLTRDTLESAYR